MDSDEGVSRPLIHKHLMVSWNSSEKGDCCGRVEAITDGFYCQNCDFFVHKKCSESFECIQHPSHPGHILWLHCGQIVSCDLCGRRTELSYHCEVCDFDMDLYCATYPPPEVIEVSQTHHHKLTLLKQPINFDCGAKCGKIGDYEFPYQCHECELSFHMDCVWHPSEANHTLEYTTMDTGERVSLPWIHKHPMMPWNDTRKGDCCRRFEAITDGYFCKICDCFVHKKCGVKAPESIQHPTHSLHPLWLQITSDTSCHLCGKAIFDMSYSCKICQFDIDLYCAKNEKPPKVIESSEMHHHKLNLLKERTDFDCDAKCSKSGEDELAYKCDECDLSFHVDCVGVQPEVDLPLEVNHSYHSLHPLKLHMGLLPDYSDGKCRLCGRKIDDRLFYHCSSCNFTLDMRCVLHPPQQSLLNLKAHDHTLNLLSRLDSFICNACGLKGDQSRYICYQYGFTIHQDCLGLPRVVKTMIGHGDLDLGSVLQEENRKWIREETLKLLMKREVTVKAVTSSC